MPPGFVSVTLAPTRSSAESVFVRALSISASKAALNSLNESRPASRITGTISVREPSFFSTSTAMPSITPPSSRRTGLPSRSSKWCAITGMSSVAALAIAQAIRCVNETFWPASLSCLRRPSICVTVSVRNEVAVGIDRLSSMYFASIAAPPRIGEAVALDAGASPAASTSAFVTRPPGPEPFTAARSTPSAAATRAATGETFMPSGVAARGGGRGAGGRAVGRVPARARRAPGRRRCACAR